MCSEKPKERCEGIPLAEWWYNTTSHSAIETTPYKVVYNQPPPVHSPDIPGETKVDRLIERREAMIQVLRFYLLRAQQRMKTRAESQKGSSMLGTGCG